MEKSPFDSFDKGSNRSESAVPADVVRSFCSRLYFKLIFFGLEDMWALDFQALNSDIIEAVKYARTMPTEEVDEMIDHILEQVILSILYDY